MIAFGFAAATAAVVTGVIAAPAISSCSGNPDKPFISCVFDSVLNRNSDEASIATTPPVEETEVVDEPVAVVAATDEVVPEAAVEPVVEPKLPDFTVARAAADGFVVIVGTADAEDTVVVKANGQILGKTKPESSGEWVFVPENPLPTGGVEITVEAQNGKGDVLVAQKSEIVLIHEGRDQEPIVVASTPGKATDIIQGLEAETAVKVAEITTATEEVAEATTAVVKEVEVVEKAKPAVEEVAPSVEEVAEVAEAVVAKVEDTAEPVIEAVEPALDETAETAVVELSQTDDAIVAELSTEENVVVETAIDSAAEVVDSAQEVAEVTPSAETQNPVETAEEVAIETAEEVAIETAEEVAIETAEEVASAQAAQVAIEAVAAFVQPTIDAIEIDGQLNFIAGGGPDGATMRVYIDNEFIADATVAEGRWLVETKGALVKATQRVRADMIVADATSVVARTEVNFVIENIEDVPAADLLVAEPAAEPVVVEADTAIAEPEVVEVASSEPALVEETAPAAEKVTVVVEEASAEVEPAVEENIQAADQVVPVTSNVAEAVETALRVEPTQDNLDEPVIEIAEDVVMEADEVVTEAADTEIATVEAAVEEAVAVASEEVAPVVQEVAEVAATTEKQVTEEQTVIEPVAEVVVEAVEVVEPIADASDEKIETLTAVATGEGDNERFVSGKAIIRQGDNLWTIAQRVYGSGVKYTTIFEANSNEISNPALIFPGQVFELPTN